MDKLKQAIDSINESIIDYNFQLGRYDAMLKSYKIILEQQTGMTDETFIQKTSDMEFLLKVNTQILISLLDLAIISKNLLSSTQKWECIFFSKHAYLTIYETLIKFSSFQKRLTGLFTDNGKCREDFVLTLKSLRNFKKNYGYETNLKMVRNKVAGHVDEDFESYFALSTSLDPGHTLEIVSSLLPIFSAIQKQTRILVQEEKVNLDKTLEHYTKEIDLKIEEINNLLKRK